MTIMDAMVMASVLTRLRFNMVGPLSDGLIRPIFRSSCFRLLSKFIECLLVAHLYHIRLYSPIGHSGARSRSVRQSGYACKRMQIDQAEGPVTKARLTAPLLRAGFPRAARARPPRSSARRTHSPGHIRSRADRARPRPNRSPPL